MKLLQTERDWTENEMRVRDVMTRMPTTISPGLSIFDAKRIMKEANVRHLPVLDQGHPVGVISNRDIWIAETFHGPGYLSVGDCISHVPYMVDSQSSLIEALTTMIDQKLEYTLVKNPRGVIIGIFTIHDALIMLRALIELGSRDRLQENHRSDRPAYPRAA